ncbi:MAG: hypothetical protein AMS18_00390 [Gemmatimonas sp. SG8_17]|nr:MAG: hypothetical protein AMS18_00390 [Gemmatimonas sp. SG8_17]
MTRRVGHILATFIHPISARLANLISTGTGVEERFLVTMQTHPVEVWAKSPDEAMEKALFETGSWTIHTERI